MAFTFIKISVCQAPVMNQWDGALEFNPFSKRETPVKIRVGNLRAIIAIHVA
jgi:hypothetical protein